VCLCVEVVGLVTPTITGNHDDRRPSSATYGRVCPTVSESNSDRNSYTTRGDASDQSDCAFLDNVVAEFGIPDIVIDDGSHQMKDMNATFNYLYPRLLKNSIYLVEDTFFSYWQEVGGGIGCPDSFIEKTKHMIDLLHADYTRGKVQSTQGARETSSIHIYDGAVVFEKQGRSHGITVTGSRQLFGEEITNNKQFAENIANFIYGNK